MANAEKNLCRDQCRENIPWYLNDTLSRNDREALAAHLEDCDVCREDIAVHEKLRAAALQHEVAPLVPPTTSLDVLDRDSTTRVSPHRGVARKWLAIAASVGGIGIALLATFYVVQGIGASEQEFETATSADTGTDIDYVLQVKFADTVLPGERGRIAKALPDVTKWSVNEAGVFEVHVQLSTPSLAALEDYENRVARMAGVESAEFTALQLPMK